MAAPDIFPRLSNWISTNFPNRLSENPENCKRVKTKDTSRKRIICPLSALSTNQNGLASCLINHRPSIMEAFANRCGLSSPNAAPLYCSIIWTLYKCGSLWNGFTAIKMFPVLWRTPGSWSDYFGIGAFDFNHFSTNPCEF